MQAIHRQLLFHTYQFVVTAGEVVDFALYDNADDVRMGDVYLAEVLRCDAQFCFLEIGAATKLFIRKKDIASTLNNLPVKVGDRLYVQVDALAGVDKWPRASGAINLSSANLVLVTDKSGLFISQKITDGKARRAIETALTGQLNDSFGIVVRTSAAQLSAAALSQEAAQLIAQFDKIVVVASEKNYRPLRYRRAYALFEKYREALDGYWATQRLALDLPFNKSSALYQKLDLLAWLGDNQQAVSATPSGVELIVEELEALTVIDVNSANFKWQGAAADFAYAVNRAALMALPTALSRRKISGTVLVDCLTLRPAEARQFVAEIRPILRDAGLIVKEMTASGLLEISIKRLAPSVKQSFYQTALRAAALKPTILIDYWLDYMIYYCQQTGQRDFQFVVSQSVYYQLTAVQQQIKQLLDGHAITLSLLVDKSADGAMQPLKSGVVTMGTKKCKIIDLMPFV